MAGVKTLLVVDDNRLVRETCKKVLEGGGFAVLLSGDGNEALNTLRSVRVDAVLLDVLMPDRDGLETLVEIKRRWPRLPVVVTTGGGVRCKLDLLTLAQKLGADAVLRKPAPAAEMIRTIADRLAAAE
jgi:CheY-like chemotaxis protein